LEKNRMSKPRLPRPFSIPDFHTTKDLSELADAVAAPWTSPSADDYFADPKKYLSRQAAQNIAETRERLPRESALRTLQEESSTLPGNPARFATLAQAAQSAAAREEKRELQNPESSRRNHGNVAVGELHFDGSAEENAVLEDLLKALKSRREPIGHWLWRMGERYNALGRSAGPDSSQGDNPKPKVIENASDLKECLGKEFYDPQKRQLCYVIFYNQKAVGTINCKQPESDMRELLYWLGKDAQGKGVMPRALQEFEKLLPPEVKHIYADIESRNFPSRNIVRDFGANPEGTVSLDPVPALWAQALPRGHTVECNMLYHKELSPERKPADSPYSAADLYKQFQNIHRARPLSEKRDIPNPFFSRGR
jgi:RimJ/RimL family protein N-acetyltransferase